MSEPYENDPYSTTPDAGFGQQSGQWTPQTSDPAAYGQASYGQPAAGAGYGQSFAGFDQPAYGQAANVGQGAYGASAYGQAAAATPQPPKPPKAPKEKGAASPLKTFFIAFAGAACACALVIGVCLGTGILHGSGSGSVISNSPVSLGASDPSAVEVDKDSTLAEAVSAKALPSVVCIYAYTNQTGYYGSRGSNADSLTQSSLGSGVVLSKDGYVITNYHVIEGADALKANIGGTEYDCDVVGSDASSDIAVIKVKDAKDLTPIELGDSDSLKVGEWVMTIGSPFGLEQSVATGIVSATSRSQIYQASDSNDYYDYIFGQSSTPSYTLYVNMIQTDAAINPGNSGGALVDKNGRLIGINTLITSNSGNYSGVGFAIPVNYAVKLAEQIIAGTPITHAQMGVNLTSVTSTLAKRYGLAVSSGAYVSSVTKGSGADAAGIAEGDIIVKFDDKAISSANDLMLAVRSKNPGDVVEVVVNRDGSEKTFQVTLGDDTASAQEQQSVPDDGSQELNERDQRDLSDIYEYLFGDMFGRR